MTKSPITHGGTDRRYQVCQCSKCNIVQQCTPRFDFYTTADDSGPLLCEDCFRDYTAEAIDKPLNKQVD